MGSLPARARTALVACVIGLWAGTTLAAGSDGGRSDGGRIFASSLDEPPCGLIERATEPGESWSRFACDLGDGHRLIFAFDDGRGTVALLREEEPLLQTDWTSGFVSYDAPVSVVRNADGTWGVTLVRVGYDNERTDVAIRVGGDGACLGEFGTLDDAVRGLGKAC